MSGSLLPFAKQIALTNTGSPGVGYQFFTYAAGTLTPKETFSDAALTVSNANPVVADARGEVTMYGTGTYRIILRDASNNTIWDRDNVSISADTLRADLAASSGSSLVGYAPQSGTATTVQAALRELQAGRMVVITDAPYNASTSRTNAQNKTSLQDAIAAVDAAGGGTIVVPPRINYGYNTRDLATYPDFTGRTNDIIVLDYGYGTADGTNKAGAQVRPFFYTAQTSQAGMHDGNGNVISGNWHPYYGVNNTANLAAVGHASRTAGDNRRARYWYYNDGKATWSIGQGTLSGAGFTNEELSNFALEHWEQTGDTLQNYSPLVIERKTGNWSIGGGTNAPDASYHFKSKTAGFLQSIFESLSTTSTIVARNSNGSADDVYWRNEAGDAVIHIPSAGDAVRVSKSTRNTTFNAAVIFVNRTKAELPAAASTTGWHYFVTDAAGGASLAFSDGTNWVSYKSGTAV